MESSASTWFSLSAEVACSSLSTFSSAEVGIIIDVSCSLESEQGETRMKWDLSVLSDCAFVSN